MARKHSKATVARAIEIVDALCGQPWHEAYGVVLFATTEELWLALAMVDEHPPKYSSRDYLRREARGVWEMLRIAGLPPGDYQAVAS